MNKNIRRSLVLDKSKGKDKSVVLKICLDKFFIKSIWKMKYMSTMILKSHTEKSPLYDVDTGEIIKDEKGKVILYDKEIVDSSIDVIHSEEKSLFGCLPRVKNKGLDY